METILRETSCYITSLLLQYALQHGFNRSDLFIGIEDKKTILENPNEWIDYRSLIRFLENYQSAGGDLFQAGVEITERQAAHFQLLFLKVATLKMILKSYSKIFEKKISPFISLTLKESEKGVINVLFTPKDKSKYSSLLCDFNRGCAYATGLLKHLRNFQLTEISCAARSEAKSCHYRFTWTPSPAFFQQIKDFFYFRFRSQKAILAHMEETYNSLQAQYNEAKQLNEQLTDTLDEKARLSESLLDLNLNLERKVVEQTSDIRSKNVELEKTNAQLRESERMKDLLTGALVHDIKNHIFSMASDVRALNNIEDCGQESRAILSHTSSACSSAMSLAANMLDIGKMEEGRLVVELQIVDFEKIKIILSRYVQNVFFKEKKISVTVEPPDFDLNFSADHYLLDRVLQNLLTNAAMYTPEGGVVRISFAEPATIAVFNSGEPIPEKYRGTLFEKYARVNTDSSKYAKGLGLFFCRLVMGAHGGSVKLECNEIGNIFIINF